MKTYKKFPGKSKTIFHGLATLILILAATVVSAQNPMMQYPDIYNNTVVFVSGGDIWKAAADGGIATRLTFSDGRESNPKFSPDGKLIAFTGEYDGNPDVYVMNTDGGNIKRITFHPGMDEVIGWNPLKNKIMFISGRQSTSRYNKMFLVSPDGTGLEEMIMYDAARGSFSPDGSKIAYNKDNQDEATWKRYTGGRAQEVFIYDFKTNAETNISNYNGADQFPMSQVMEAIKLFMRWVVIYGCWTLQQRNRKKFLYRYWPIWRKPARS